MISKDYKVEWKYDLPSLRPNSILPQTDKSGRYSTKTAKSLSSKKLRAVKEYFKEGKTTCIIHLNDTHIEGVATCSILDNFSKSKGRKLAFKMAVSRISDKKMRSKLWETYKETFPNYNK